MTLEEKLVQRLRQQAQSAAALGIPEPKRLFQAAERFGAAEALSGLFSRGRLSDSFDALADAGHLELSPEALVVSKEFGPLFSDEEADFCLQALLQAGRLLRIKAAPYTSVYVAVFLFIGVPDPSASRPRHNSVRHGRWSASADLRRNTDS